MEITAIIPARGNSKGIKRKNLVNFCNKPLIYWSIKQALESKLITNVVVTSDNSEILNFSEKCGAIAIKRPIKISGDKASSESALIHAIKTINFEIDVIVFLQATSPLRSTNDIDDAIKKFLKDKSSSLFSGSKMNDFNIWSKSKRNLKSINYNWKKRTIRQSKKNEIWCENGSIYVTKPKHLLKNKNRLTKKITIYEMLPYQAFEIDEIEDIPFMETIFRKFFL